MTNPITLEQFAEIIQKQLIVRRFPGQDGRWCSIIDGASTREGHFLVGKTGDGNSPDEALRRYAKEISGDVLVFGCSDSPGYQEFKVPGDLR